MCYLSEKMKKNMFYFLDTITSTFFARHFPIEMWFNFGIVLMIPFKIPHYNCLFFDLEELLFLKLIVYHKREQTACKAQF